MIQGEDPVTHVTLFETGRVFCVAYPFMDIAYSLLDLPDICKFSRLPCSEW